MTNILLIIIVLELSGILSKLKDITERGRKNAGDRD